MIDIIGTVAFLLLLVIHALLAAAGSALKNSHPARLRQLEREGVEGAALAARASAQATRLLLSLRLSQGALHPIILALALSLYAQPLSNLIGSSLVALVSVVLLVWLITGAFQYAAENFVLRSPVRWALRLAPLVAAVEAVSSPLVWLVLRLGRWIAQSPITRRFPLVTEEEIITLVHAGEESGVLGTRERRMIYSVFQLGDTLAREVMVPRIDVVALEDSTAISQATDELLRTGYSRAPVYDESIDDIIGLVYVKDVLARWREGDINRPVVELVREAYFVPEAKKVDELLSEMQAKRIQMAVVVDEYGGTAGLVTFEDIVEEIVGEVRDEYDIAEELPFQKVEEDEYLFSGGIDLDDVNELVAADLPKDTSETLGGYIYSHLGRVPKPGEELSAGGLQLVVEQVVGRRIHKVRAHRLPEEDDGREEAGSHDR